ncbi:chromosomal replication initiator protein DnaA [Sandarakinorhabdus cyanobacteriorum]|uniref:chromosomal replication initiator protein DnaA n=1 Tax=Sandarakinorhabdus cyanobacteriorum TaxID=1981098 RepID=UPI001FAEABED|nr:chromosomal replication initiator protein DnaA [Sandarakinorhabdus cyanobacteriorum]
MPPSNPVDPAVRELWQRVRTALRQEAGDHVFDAWLAPVAILGCDGDLVRLAAPSAFDADWVNSNYGDSLRRHFAAQNPALRRVSVTAAGPAASPVPSRAMPQSAPSQPLPVDARYNFDNFIVGKANELAYNAALTMAEPGAPGFNPLFLHGATGLGKTHLMHAIGNAFLARHPQARVAYLSAEKFMVEFMAAMRAKDTISFKQRLRSVDLLMIDDVQFIAGKDSTQEEFFHTMNEIIGAGKRLVITADRSPQNLEGIQERILSRMAWGLVADINPADYELRLNILQAKVATLGNRVQVPDDVVEFLARKITANVRELEGALNRVTAFALLIGKPITLEFTRETLADLLRAHEKKLTIDEIQRKVADYYGLRLADLLSERRAREVARPRQIAMYLAKKMTPRSLPEIGRRFGNRDHTTVMHAVKKVEELRAKDREIDSDVATLARLLDG